MRSKDSIFGSFGKWQDRVEEGDVFHRTPVEEIVAGAIEFAQIIVDAAIEPLIDFASDFRDKHEKATPPQSAKS